MILESQGWFVSLHVRVKCCPFVVSCGFSTEESRQQETHYPVYPNMFTKSSDMTQAQGVSVEDQGMAVLELTKARLATEGGDFVCLVILL